MNLGRKAKVLARILNYTWD